MLEQEDKYLGSRDLSHLGEDKIDDFGESARVVVERRAGVAKGLQDRVDLQDLVLHVPVKINRDSVLCILTLLVYARNRVKSCSKLSNREYSFLW